MKNNFKFETLGDNLNILADRNSRAPSTEEILNYFLSNCVQNMSFFIIRSLISSLYLLYCIFLNFKFEQAFFFS